MQTAELVKVETVEMAGRTESIVSHWDLGQDSRVILDRRQVIVYATLHGHDDWREDETYNETFASRRTAERVYRKELVAMIREAERWG